MNNGIKSNANQANISKIKPVHNVIIALKIAWRVSRKKTTTFINYLKSVQTINNSSLFKCYLMHRHSICCSQNSALSLIHSQNSPLMSLVDDVSAVALLCVRLGRIVVCLYSRCCYRFSYCRYCLVSAAVSIYENVHRWHIEYKFW